MRIAEKVHWLLDIMKEKIVTGRVRDSVLALQCALKNELFFYRCVSHSTGNCKAAIET